MNAGPHPASLVVTVPLDAKGRTAGLDVPVPFTVKDVAAVSRYLEEVLLPATEATVDEYLGHFPHDGSAMFARALRPSSLEPSEAVIDLAGPGGMTAREVLAIHTAAGDWLDRFDKLHSSQCRADETAVAIVLRPALVKLEKLLDASSDLFATNDALAAAAEIRRHSRHSFTSEPTK